MEDTDSDAEESELDYSYEDAQQRDKVNATFSEETTESNIKDTETNMNSQSKTMDNMKEREKLSSSTKKKKIKFHEKYGAGFDMIMIPETFIGENYGIFATALLKLGVVSLGLYHEKGYYGSTFPYAVVNPEKKTILVKGDMAYILR